MNCIVCDETPKYKCPTCVQPYCSVGCYKKHKEVPCKAPILPEGHNVPEKNRSEREYKFSTDDTVPVEKLKLLEHSSELKICLENRHVRDILKELDNAMNPDDLVQEYMQEPIFTEFVDACLKVIQPQDQNG